VKGFSLSPQEKEDLPAFLLSLTDEGLPNNPRFSNTSIAADHCTAGRSLLAYVIAGGVGRRAQVTVLESIRP